MYTIYDIDTKASEKLTAMITNTRFCNYVKYMSPKYQTSSLEAFHSTINHFAPKSVAFSYKGMIGRCGIIQLQNHAFCTCI